MGIRADPDKLRYGAYSVNKRDQKPEESVELYISALKDLLQSCNLCDCMRDSLMRDIIVLGIVDVLYDYIIIT